MGMAIEIPWTGNIFMSFKIASTDIACKKDITKIEIVYLEEIKDDY